MTALKPHSKAGQLRAADKMLRALLRTPKTRGGLVAAVKSAQISRNYVFGWLSERRRDGSVTKLRSSTTVMYQIASHVVCEVPAESVYPSWLDPRALPVSTNRTAYIDGAAVKGIEK